MSRLGGCLALAALLPVVLAASAFVVSVFPWWAVAFGVLFWFLVARRRAAGPAAEPVEGGAVFSPFRGGGY